MERIQEAEQETPMHETVQWALDLVKRRRWWIFLPTSCLAIASAALFPRLPKTFSSEAILVVVQPQVSPVYVPPAMSLNPSETVRTLSREVLSRPRLTRIIEELGLYPEMPRTDGLVEHMRDNIDVAPLGLGPTDYSAFRLSFSAETPYLAQAVTTRLASLFIEENLKTQGARAEETAAFLSEQLKAAKQKLAEQEETLKNFKLRNLGQLPEEQAANLATLTALRSQLQHTMDNLARVKRLRESLEGSLRADLARLAAQRTELLKDYTSQHRTVVAKDQEITKTQGLLDRLRGLSVSEAISIGAGPGDPFAQVRAQVDANVSEMASLTADETRLKSEIARYEKRLNLTPITQAQLTAVLRDYEQSSRNYNDLLEKQLQSRLAANIEERQQGQQFRLVDPPSLPQKPSKPNPKKFLLGGMAAGLALGIGLAVGMEMLNRTLHEEKQVARAYPAPLVVSIPLMLTEQEIQRRQWVRGFEWAVGIVLLIVVGVTELVVFRQTLQ
jgi:polysaccharide chain length determinant protein (PEP-CTERM system associated)